MENMEHKEGGEDAARGGVGGGVERRKFLARRALRYWGALFLMVASVAGGYKLWNYYQYRGQYQALENYNAIVEMMKNDTYGGVTPEETLELFVAALKEGDVEKASLYFALDESGSREKWRNFLEDIKSANKLVLMIKDLETRIVSAGNSIDENDFAFEIYNPNGTVALTIDLMFNGKVWKIESL